MWKKIKKAVKKVGNAVASAVIQAVNVVKEVVNRVLGVVDFVATLFGLKLRKKIRLRIVILRDEHGKEIVSQAEVEPSIRYAREVFKREVNTVIVGAGGDLIRTVGGTSPSAALDVHCQATGHWGDDFGDAGAYFRREAAYNATGLVIGYAAPVTVFVVRDVRGEGGCSLGAIADYVTLDRGGVDNTPPRVLAHEIGHACGLWHLKARSNLMHPDADGGILRRWQEAIFRDSRHVTFL